MATQTIAKTTPGESRSNDAAVSYEQDYHAWLAAQARVLRERRVGEIDASNLAEELEESGAASKRR
jgi:hypothetical protein